MGDFHYRITGKTNDNQLKMEGGWQNNRQSGLSKENRMVENIFEELDAPGEWFYDSKTSTLYYYPYNDEDVNKVTFETAQLKHLLEFRGTLEKPVKNIFLKGFILHKLGAPLWKTMNRFCVQIGPSIGVER